MSGGNYCHKCHAPEIIWNGARRLLRNDELKFYFEYLISVEEAFQKYDEPSQKVIHNYIYDLFHKGITEDVIKTLYYHRFEDERHKQDFSYRGFLRETLILYGEYFGGVEKKRVNDLLNADILNLAEDPNVSYDKIKTDSCFPSF